MEILYDYQTFIDQKFGGISRYFAELMTRLPEGYHFRNPVVLSSNVYLKSVPGMWASTMWLPRFMKKGKKAYRINESISRRVLERGKYDIFHPTYYNPYFLKSVKRPYVITVHDMIHEKFAEIFPERDHTAEMKKLTVMNASRIIAISNNTKKDLMELYGIPDDRIDVVYQGYGLDTSREESVEGLPSRYILYVGGRFGYKNFDRFCEAFSLLHREYPDIELVCTGVPFDPMEQAMIDRLGIRVYNLGHEQFRFKIIESDPDICRALPAKCPDAEIIMADACDPEMWTETGLDSADAFVALTQSSETNILACMAAKDLGVKRTMAEVENLQFISLAEGMNIGKVINKKLLASSSTFQLMLDDDESSSKCLALTDAEVAELEVKPKSRITEAPVKDLRLPRSMTLAALIRDGRGMLVSGNTHMQSGDRVLVFFLQGAIHKVERLFN